MAMGAPSGHWQVKVEICGVLVDVVDGADPAVETVAVFPVDTEGESGIVTHIPVSQFCLDGEKLAQE